jgi:mRNA-degrading endonuclease RelE of RelBE toxin-antitoxin system/DNA-binding XRE family transcriptional regulator
MVEVFQTVRAQKKIRKLPTALRARVAARIAELSAYPDVSGIKPLQGALAGVFSTRVGPKRILFTIGSGSITITDVDDRRDVYERDLGRSRVQLRIPRGILSRNIALRFAVLSIGQDLRSARMRAGFTQAELAKRLHRTQPLVSGAEKGRFLQSERLVLAVLKACGLPAGWGGS